MFKKKKVSVTEDQNKMAEENNIQPENIQEEVEQVNEARQSEFEESTEEISEVDKLKAEVAGLNDKYVRLYAEFDNFKRRTTKERIELLQTAGKDVIVSMLSVLDDFERAAKAMESATEVKPVKEGIELVHHKLKSLLNQKGLKEMESKGKPFDPEIHEAITNIPAPTDNLKGKVVEEVEKGYFLNDKVIRFAKVVVGA
ncbi:MAG: nucleotide exchange factor GrpE [Bacteroidetes bacterium]|nr:nucleotide exchange factor GrpE [Bacteroidota bacterium]MBU1373218.1 nucleotide exchange factor GrpE [Bacteroidota bacterium]MBU1486290.1 nucleotide exchange factor GrpE [Bacteroidota bacterium]MBU1759651.1 nucleotide exchange factor GrpE [Bacteroidota bacterium]MBU2267211.1 nucleotide exchange factor GrpE [Bacteroidota bacterium]